METILQKKSSECNGELFKNLSQLPKAGPLTQQSAKANGGSRATWDDYASDLAQWALERAFSRHDTFAEWQKGGEQWQREKKPITAKRLTEHFLGYRTLGSYTLGTDSKGRYLGIDIDKHDENGNAIENELYARRKYDTLAELGFHPLLESSNGDGGFHSLGIL